MTYSVIARTGDKKERFNNVVSIDQPLGDAEPIYNRCGHSIFGLVLCPDCQPDGQGCGKFFVEAILRHEPGMCTLFLENGSQIQVEEFEFVGDNSS